MQCAVSATTNSGKLIDASASADLPGQWLIANFHVAWNAPLPCTRLSGNGTTSGVILGGPRGE